MNDHTSVKVKRLPTCDFCNAPARYDGRTNFGPGFGGSVGTQVPGGDPLNGSGQWANMCQRHFDSYGIGLGLGKGQRLVLEDEEDS